MAVKPDGRALPVAGRPIFYRHGNRGIDRIGKAPARFAWVSGKPGRGSNGAPGPPHKEGKTMKTLHAPVPADALADAIRSAVEASPLGMYALAVLGLAVVAHYLAKAL